MVDVARAPILSTDLDKRIKSRPQGDKFLSFTLDLTLVYAKAVARLQGQHVGYR